MTQNIIIYLCVFYAGYNIYIIMAEEV